MVPTYNFNLNVKVYKLTVDNLEEVADFCGGAVKGIKLPIAQRCIDFWYGDTEHRIEIGQYLMYIGPIPFVLYHNDLLRIMMEFTDQ